MTFSQNTAKDRGNIGSTANVLQNRCSTAELNRHSGSFLGFLPKTRETGTRRKRNGGLNVAAQEVAQSVPRRFPDLTRLHGGGLDRTDRARVYFIGGGGLIKIGVTADVDQRLRKLQLACPVELNYFGSFPGMREAERGLHAKFKHLRKHGEWFLDTEELRAEIVRLCGDLWLEGIEPSSRHYD